jgi:hypothetical protein
LAAEGLYPGAGVAPGRGGPGARRQLAVAALLAAVVAVYLPYLLHVVTPSPLGILGGLTTRARPGLLPGYPWIDPNVGFVSQALGKRAALDLLHGHLPWWNPYEAVGVPLAGELQSSALFPLSLLLVLPGGQVVSHLLLQCLAALATYALLRQLERSRLASAVGAVLFGLNGTFAWLPHAPFNPVAFLPVILLGVERCARNPKGPLSDLSWVLIALGLALSVYAGFPEVAYLNGLLALAWAALRWWQRRHRRALGAKAALGALAGLGLSAPLLVAFLDFVRYADTGGHNGAFAHAHLPGAAAASLGTPYAYGPIFGLLDHDRTGLLNLFWGNVGGYATVLVLFAAAVGLATASERALAGLLAAWTALAWAKTFGLPPVVALVNLVPGMREVAFYRYAPPSWEMALAVLAAFGVDGLGRTARRPAVLAGLATGAVALVVARSTGSQLLGELTRSSSLGRWFGWGSLAWALGTLAVAGALALGRRAWSAAAVGGLLALEAMAMFALPELSAPGPAQLDSAPVAFLQAHLGLQRFYTLGPIPPNYGAYFGIASVNQNDIPISKDWAAYVTARLDPNVDPLVFVGNITKSPSGPTPLQALRRNLPAYEAVGVAYVVAPAGTAGLPGRPVFADPMVTITELASPSPFYRTAGICRLEQASWDAARLHCLRAARLVRAEGWLPGWTATVNGRPEPVRRSGPLFMSVALPPGTSEVAFSYSPPGVALSLVPALLGLGLVLGAVAYRLRARASLGVHRRASGAVGRRGGQLGALGGRRSEGGSGGEWA